MRLGLVRVLGWLVIAHGLSHAVLPLRGSLGPSLAIDDWVPAGLYAIGMVGFVAAGLGLLGLKPLDRAISPLLVLASGLSLVALVRFADPTLWFGAACDVALLLLGLWRAYGGWPEHPSHGRRWHVIGVTVGFALLVYVAGATLLYPWHRTWGSTREELLMALPGDSPNRDPALETQHAVTVAASAAEVWPLLRALGRELETGRTVTYFDAARAVVVGGTTMVALDAPEGRTRVIIRSQFGDARLPVWSSAWQLTTLGLPQFFTERRLLLSLKTHAEEGRARSTALR
jgi:hypothetical protein